MVCNSWVVYPENVSAFTDSMNMPFMYGADSGAVHWLVLPTIRKSSLTTSRIRRKIASRASTSSSNVM